jgi:hypothetical protein
VSGNFTGTPSGLSVEVRFFDITDHSSSGGKRLSGDTGSVKRLAHRMADAVLEYVTGTPGPFDSKIAYVSNRDGRFREIYVMTLDGATMRATRHNAITMAPSWNPTARSILFTSFKGGAPRLYSVDVTTGFDSRIAGKLGVNVGGMWSPTARAFSLRAKKTGTPTSTSSTRRASRRAGSRRTGESTPTDLVARRLAARILFVARRIAAGLHHGDRFDRGAAAYVRRRVQLLSELVARRKMDRICGQRGGQFQIFVIAAAGGPATQLTAAARTKTRRGRPIRVTWRSPESAADSGKST